MLCIMWYYHVIYIFAYRYTLCLLILLLILFTHHILYGYSVFSVYSGWGEVVCMPPSYVCTVSGSIVESQKRGGIYYSTKCWAAVEQQWDTRASGRQWRLPFQTLSSSSYKHTRTTYVWRARHGCMAYHTSSSLSVTFEGSLDFMIQAMT